MYADEGVDQGICSSLDFMRFIASPSLGRGPAAPIQSRFRWTCNSGSGSCLDTRVSLAFFSVVETLSGSDEGYVSDVSRMAQAICELPFE